MKKIESNWDHLKCLLKVQNNIILTQQIFLKISAVLFCVYGLKDRRSCHYKTIHFQIKLHFHKLSQDEKSGDSDGEEAEVSDEEELLRRREGSKKKL